MWPIRRAVEGGHEGGQSQLFLNKNTIHHSANTVGQLRKRKSWTSCVFSVFEPEVRPRFEPMAVSDLCLFLLWIFDCRETSSQQLGEAADSGWTLTSFAFSSSLAVFRCMASMVAERLLRSAYRGIWSGFGAMDVFCKESRVGNETLSVH